ncbi:MAG: hypothetical protein Q7J29_14740 [Stagnimonas sp.]|nr:hypothetical protein [Stagnimonas sp.]
MNNPDPAGLHPFVVQQLNVYTSGAQDAMARIAAATSMVDIARALRFAPQAPAYIRWASEVRTLKHRMNEAGESRAAEMIKLEVERCKAHRESGNADGFTASLHALQRDMRLLAGYTPRALREGLREVAKLKASPVVGDDVRPVVRTPTKP